MSWLILAMLGCEQKNGGSSFEQTVSDEASSVGQPEQDTAFDEPLSEEDCIPMNETADADPNDLTGRPDCGYYTYSQSCIGCHGADGDGTPSGSQLVGYIEDLADSDLIDSIVNGKGTMPPYDMMHPQSVADVVAYMREEFQ